MQPEAHCHSMTGRTYCLGVFLIVCLLSAAACSDSFRPPFIKAQVIDVYNNKTEIYNAHFHYWWQERGETAFLDTYTETSRELMTAVVQPGSANTNAALKHVSIHLRDIEKIEWNITETGKIMLLHRRSAPVVEAKCLFPPDLRVDPSSGLADYTCSIIGKRGNKSGDFDFKQDLNFMKSLIITEVDEGR